MPSKIAVSNVRNGRGNLRRWVCENKAIPCSKTTHVFFWILRKKKIYSNMYRDSAPCTDNLTAVELDASVELILFSRMRCYSVELWLPQLYTEINKGNKEGIKLKPFCLEAWLVPVTSQFFIALSPPAVFRKNSWKIIWIIASHHMRKVGKQSFSL